MAPIDSCAAGLPELLLTEVAERGPGAPAGAVQLGNCIADESGRYRAVKLATVPHSPGLPGFK